MDLTDIRKDIDKIDSELIKLLEKRMECSKAVAQYKLENNIPILDRNRELLILEKVEQKSEKYGTQIKFLFEDIMQISRMSQNRIIGDCPFRETLSKIQNNVTAMPLSNIKVACQGIRGANSHIACNEFFEDPEIDFYKTFADVFKAVEEDKADFGVLPVENTSGGSVSDVYDLLMSHNFYIVSAKALTISHNLCALKQSEFSDIEQVWSHPQALTQCSSFICDNDLNPIAYPNTAIAAKKVMDEKRLNCAAICTTQAAEEYGLKVLKENIQDYNKNTTRFIVISKKPYINENANKISLCFNVEHEEGALSKVLNMFSLLGLNLTKIESRPMKNAEFDYLFYLDFTGNLRDQSVVDFLCTLSEEVKVFSFMGNYFEN